MTDEQFEQMFISLSKSIDKLGDTLSAKIDNKVNELRSEMLVKFEEQARDIKGVAEGVSLLLERREEDELWRAEMDARVLKLEAEIQDIKKRLRSA